MWTVFKVFIELLQYCFCFIFCSLAKRHVGSRLPAAAAAKSLQLCPTLCDPREGSPPGFPIPGILQAKTLGWVAISFSDV